MRTSSCSPLSRLPSKAQHLSAWWCATWPARWWADGWLALRSAAGWSARWLVSALKLDPGHQTTRQALLECLQDLNDADLRERCRRFLEQKSNDPAIRFQTAEAYRQVGDIRGYLGDNEKSLSSSCKKVWGKPKSTKKTAAAK